MLGKASVKMQATRLKYLFTNSTTAEVCGNRFGLADFLGEGRVSNAAPNQCDTFLPQIARVAFPPIDCKKIIDKY
jgi:hypothetical protein